VLTEPRWLLVAFNQSPPVAQEPEYGSDNHHHQAEQDPEPRFVSGDRQLWVRIDLWQDCHRRHLRNRHDVRGAHLRSCIGWIASLGASLDLDDDRLGVAIIVDVLGIWRRDCNDYDFVRHDFSIGRHVLGPVFGIGIGIGRLVSHARVGFLPDDRLVMCRRDFDRSLVLVDSARVDSLFVDVGVDGLDGVGGMLDTERDGYEERNGIRNEYGHRNECHDREWDIDAVGDIVSRVSWLWWFRRLDWTIEIDRDEHDVVIIFIERSIVAGSSSTI
jgi:hypothetical protein